MKWLNYAVYIAATWNIAVFAMYGIDKHKARKGKWRISEKALILPAFLMGALGAFAGMRWFRHKTKHLKFRILIPLAVVANAALIAGCMILYSNVYNIDGGKKTMKIM